MSNDTFKEDIIWDELIAIEHELLSCVKVLIYTEWDAPKLKLRIISLYKSRIRLQRELDKFYHNQRAGI